MLSAVKENMALIFYSELKDKLILSRQYFLLKTCQPKATFSYAQQRTSHAQNIIHLMHIIPLLAAESNFAQLLFAAPVCGWVVVTYCVSCTKQCVANIATE